MVKNAPYLFGGALTISSIVCLSFSTPLKEIFFKEHNLLLAQNCSESTSKNRDVNEPTEGKYLAYAAPLVGSTFSYDMSGAATYQISSVQGVDVACITNDRTNFFYPVGGLGIQPPEVLAWGFKVQLGHKLEETEWVVRTEYNFYKAVANSGTKVPYGQGFSPSAYANTLVDKKLPLFVIFSNLDMGTNTSLNNFRLNLSRPSMITPSLEYTTQLGFEANFFQRRQLSVFSNAVGDTNTGYVSNLGGFFQNYQKFSWWGLGPSIALTSRWDLGSHFYFLANGYGAITYGNSFSRTATFSKRVIGTGTFDAREAAVQNGMYQFAPSMRYLIGLEYCYLSVGSESQVNFQISYETAYYFNLIRTITPEGAFRGENGAGYGLQGLILQAGVTF
jgi:hypothetical protein